MTNTIRFASVEDQDQVAELAKTSFRYSRFHMDPYFDDSTADTIKAEWARNFFLGKRGDAMVVAEADGKITGFCQLLRTGENEWVIDLIAVDPAQRRRHIARDLIAFAESHLEHCERILVGTQVANVPSMRLYENMGFRIKSASYVLHYHGGQPGAGA